MSDKSRPITSNTNPNSSNNNDELKIGIDENIRQNQYIYDQYYENDFTIAVSSFLMDFLSKYYFRASFVGFENDNFPQRNNPDVPLIYISNHSGMAFPWDGMLLASQYYRKTNYDFNIAFRPITAPMLSQSTLMNPYMVPNLWRHVGSIDANFLNFETMMNQSEANVMVFPEGVPGIGKGFNNRYKLQRFSSSFVYNSIKYKTDVPTLITINGEYINPHAYSIKPINKLVNKLGIPFFPIGFLTPFLLICPWIFYMAFPAKLTFVKCQTLRPYQMTDKSIDELSRPELQEIAEQCRQILQKDLDDAVAKYGQKPYQWKEHLKIIWDNRRLFPFTVPPGWPLLFSEFERVYKEHKETGKEINMDITWKSVFRIILQNPIVLCYYIPILGWIPLLIKGYRDNNL